MLTPLVQETLRPPFPFWMAPQTAEDQGWPRNYQMFPERRHEFATREGQSRDVEKT
jgi:hypothetical protein